MTDMRKCIGSATFGIETHEAPPEDFPAQPSQKDGLGRMCRPHWKQYVSALGKARRAAATAGGGVATEVAPTVQLQAAARVATKRAARVAKPEPIGATSESPAVKIRRAKLADRIAAAGGVGTDAGQLILEAAGTAEGSIA